MKSLLILVIVYMALFVQVQSLDVADFIPTLKDKDDCAYKVRLANKFVNSFLFTLYGEAENLPENCWGSQQIK